MKLSSKIMGENRRDDKRVTQQAVIQPEPRPGKVDGEAEVLANIATMPEPDRMIAGRIHVIIKANAPALSPRL